jgi:hypothetical protein
LDSEEIRAACGRKSGAVEGEHPERLRQWATVRLLK